MSENGNPSKMPLVCGRCQQSWSIPAPTMEIMNAARTSVVTVDHGKVVRCINGKCRQPYLLAIAQAQLAFAVNGITDEQAAELEGSPIIKPNLVLAH